MPLLSGQPRQHATVSDFSILRSDNNSLLIEFRPTYAPRQQTRFGGVEYVLFPFSGSVLQSASAHPGEPDLRYRVFPLALPALTGNRVAIVAADYEEVRGVSYLPLPSPKESEGRQTTAPSGQIETTRSENGYLPGGQVVLVVGGVVGDVVTGSLQVFPVTYNSSLKTVRKYARVVVEVTFGKPLGGFRAGGEDPLLRHGLLNYGAVRPAVAARITAFPPANSLLAGGEWYRLPVTQEGIFKLDVQFLSAAGINVSTLDPRTIKIYGNGGKHLPEDPTAPRPVDLVENAIYIQGGADGKFDAGDYVLFYGRSLRGWNYDSTAKTYRHYINLYGETNYYWLTFGGSTGKRMETLPSVDLPASFSQDQTLGLAFVEEEKFNRLRSGKDWLGQTLSGPNSSFTHVISLPGLVPGSTLVYRMHLVASSDSPPTITVKEGGTVLGVVPFPRISGWYTGYGNQFETTGNSSLPNTVATLTFTLNSVSAGAQAWIDWIEILYPRRLWGVNEFLRFRSPEATGIVEYNLQQFTAAPMVFDVTPGRDPRYVTGIVGSYIFRASETTGRSNEYCAAGSSAWKTPEGIEKISNQNLRGLASGADFIIITTPEFRASAERIKTLREQPQYGNLKTLLVEVQTIDNEFSGGVPDISGIRDFLKYAYENWSPRPKFVLLFGQASFDYKGNLGSRSSYVPTWQSTESLHEIDSYATDDFFGRFSATTAPSLVIGRINARNTRDAQVVVDKIYRYEQSAVRDTWKMRILFVGDDAWTSDGGDSDGSLHSDQTEALATYFTPDELEKRKIYIAEYPTVNAAQGRRKPLANEAIVSEINQGALIINFAGHGNQSVWTHERVFEVGSSIPLLNNRERLALFFLGTCNFSVYDDPQSTTGSEELLNRSDGGAVAVVAANRKVYAGDNAALNQGSFSQMFTRDSMGVLRLERPATSLFLFKATGGNSVNDQKYGFMGDPTMALQYPVSYAAIDSINGESIDSVGGFPRTSPIRLKSLAKVTVKGTMRRADHQVDQTYNGKLTLQVNDVSRQQLIVDFYPGYNWQYTATGGMVYRGESSITQGRFSSTFVVPKDIAYADTTGRGRIVAYSTGSGADGAAYTGGIIVGGTDSTARNDARGPEISIYLGTRGFRSGDMVDEKPELFVDLSDSSGINTSTTSIGHRIEAWVNNSSQSNDLTSYYSSTLDDYRHGSIATQLGPLPMGRNTIRVRAWDSYNNSSFAETYFEVASSGQLAIADVYNYPNPFKNSTFFTFRHNQNGTVRAKIRVYTLAGRAIRTLEEEPPAGSFVRIAWDGRDDDGDLIANGVYLYKVIVGTDDGKYTSEALGKLTIVR